MVRADRPQDFRIGDMWLGLKGHARNHTAVTGPSSTTPPVPNVAPKTGENDQSAARHRAGRWRDDVHAFDRRQHGNRRCDDGVAEEKRCPDDADGEHQASAWETPGASAISDAAPAAVVARRRT